MAPKSYDRVAVEKEHFLIEPLLKEHVPEDPALQKMAWWGKDLDHVIEFYLPFLVAVAGTGKVLGKNALKKAVWRPRVHP